MKIVALMGEKGGTGRSMLAVQLAVAATAAGVKTCVLDTNPRGNIWEWAAQRHATGLGMPEVSLAQSPLASALDAAQRMHYGLVLIDCSAAARAADIIGSRAVLVLLPFRPALPDMQKMLEGASALRARAQVLAVCNGANAGTSEAKEALEFLAEAGQVKCARTVIHDRVLFRRTFAAGKGVAEMGSKSKAKDEIIALYQELVL